MCVDDASRPDDGSHTALCAPLLSASPGAEDGARDPESDDPLKVPLHLLKNPSQDDDPAAGLSTFVLAILVFFNVSGGPFGLEPAVKAAGNLFAIVGVAAMPLLFSLPEAVMTYELSSRYPCASGGVRWVRTTS